MTQRNGGHCSQMSVEINLAKHEVASNGLSKINK